jgi:hypothetical protein
MVLTNRQEFKRGFKRSLLSNSVYILEQSNNLKIRDLKKENVTWGVGGQKSAKKVSRIT